MDAATGFSGAGYVPELDFTRLMNQLERVFDFMKDEQWHTLREVSEAAHGPEASISAAIRSLRKPKHGGYVVDRRRVDNYYEYRLILDPALRS